MFPDLYKKTLEYGLDFEIACVPMGDNTIFVERVPLPPRSDRR